MVQINPQTAYIYIYITPTILPAQHNKQLSTILAQIKIDSMIKLAHHVFTFSSSS